MGMYCKCGREHMEDDDRPCPACSAQLQKMGMRGIVTDLRTQDNAGTEQPIFAVQQRKRIYGFDPDYCDEPVWLHCDGGEASGTELDELHEAYVKGEDTPGEWTRTGYQDRWEFVTACLTQRGCQAYIHANGHNLTDPRIYVYTGHRNTEWELVRRFLSGLPHLLPTPTQGGSMPNLPIPSVGRIVLYVLPSGPRAGEVRPAVITRVWNTDYEEPQGPCMCNLQVFRDQADDFPGATNTPDGCFSQGSVSYDGAINETAGEFTYAPGTWHWPPRV